MKLIFYLLVLVNISGTASYIIARRTIPRYTDLGHGISACALVISLLSLLSATLVGIVYGLVAEGHSSYESRQSQSLTTQDKVEQSHYLSYGTGRDRFDRSFFRRNIIMCLSVIGLCFSWIIWLVVLLTSLKGVFPMYFSGS